jgi:hypothetical protein
MPGGVFFLTTFGVFKYYPVIKEMTIPFVAPARTDVTMEMSLSKEEASRIEAEAKEMGKGDYIFFSPKKGGLDDRNMFLWRLCAVVSTEPWFDLSGHGVDESGEHSQCPR